MSERTTPPRGANWLLAALGAGEAAGLAPLLEPVSLELRQTIIVPNQPISHVYFVDTGLVSVVSELEHGRMIEVLTVGVEGMVGVPLFLAASTTTCRAFVQLAGSAHRMAAATFMTEMKKGGELRTRVERYTQLSFEQVSHTAACNRGHAVQQRCARWLLMVHDQVHREKRFEITQEFLSQMLGVRRASVAVVAASLQRAGVIEYVRGVMTIVDRRRLEKIACGCYRKFRDAQQQLLGVSP
jgi:CRP-like cAMP-binding protein